VPDSHGKVLLNGSLISCGSSSHHGRMDDLEKMLAKLLKDARRLPPGQKRHELLKDIGRFQVKIDALKKRKKLQPTK
jgi:hypothetical protein